MSIESISKRLEATSESEWDYFLEIIKCRCYMRDEELEIIKYALQDIRGLLDVARAAKVCRDQTRHDAASMLELILSVNRLEGME